MTSRKAPINHYFMTSDNATVAPQPPVRHLTSAEHNLSKSLCNLYHLVSAHTPYEACCISYSNACLVIHIDERQNRTADGRGKRESQTQIPPPGL